VLFLALFSLSFAGIQGAWVPFTAVFVLVAAYAEFENIGYDIFNAAISSVLSTTGFILLGLLFWLHSAGQSLGGWFHSVLDSIESALSASTQAATVMSIEDLSLTFPATILVSLMLSLWMGVIFEARFRLWLGQSVVFAKSALTYNVPGVFVWLTMTSVAAAYIDHGNETIRIIGMNAVQVFAAVYFFQGLTIVATYFRVTRMGQFWQILMYGILLLQLSIVLSALGFADYWLEIKNKLIKKSAQSVKG
ncbi:MAG: DUF2232 domain-containing protein, partial [Bdellovibrionales bacterium]|nr:DUF2232 domain-containing protein [Bdellovibrionales bacterium]